MIDIVLSERDFDYEIQALVTGFFPAEHNRVVILEKQDENSLKALAQTDADAALFVGAFFGQDKITVWLLNGGKYCERSVTVSGEQDFHKHVDKTTHPYRTDYKNKLKKLLFTILCEMDIVFVFIFCRS